MSAPSTAGAATSPAQPGEVDAREATEALAALGRQRLEQAPRRDAQLAVPIDEVALDHERALEVARERLGDDRPPPAIGMPDAGTGFCSLPPRQAATSRAKTRLRIATLSCRSYAAAPSSVSGQRLDPAVADPPGGELAGARASRIRYGRPSQRPMFSTSVRDGPRRRRRGASGRPRARSPRPRGTRPPGRCSSSKRYGRRRRRCAAARSARRRRRASSDQAAGLVRRLRVARARSSSRAHRGRDHHQTVRSIDALDVVGASQKSAERYFQPPSARIADDDALVELVGEPARDVDDRARRRRRRRCPPGRAARARPATDSSFETSIFRSSFETSRIGGT